MILLPMPNADRPFAVSLRGCFCIASEPVGCAAESFPRSLQINPKKSRFSRPYLVLWSQQFMAQRQARWSDLKAGVRVIQRDDGLQARTIAESWPASLMLLQAL